MAGGAGGVYFVASTQDGNDATQVVAETATPPGAETGTATVTPDAATPAPSAENEATPEIVTPIPATALRPDCPGGWAVADEPNFSFCYPTNLRVEQAADFGLTVYNLTTLGKSPPFVLIAIGEDTGRGFDPQKGCEAQRIGGLLENAETFSEITVAWANGSQAACFAAGTSLGLEYRGFRLDIPVESHFLAVLVSYSAPDPDAQRATIDLLLGTLVIR
jgi:hypothetical protein